MWFYFLIFLSSVILSVLFTLIMKKVSFACGILDYPYQNNQERKIHKKNIPLLGGVAIFLSFFLVLFYLRYLFLARDLDLHHLLGFFFGALILVIGGVLDDKYDFSPKLQILFPIFACLSIIWGGVGIEKITNPFDNSLFYLSSNFLLFFSFSKIFTFIWLLGMTYTTKLLDGIDGLVSGVVAIGALIIFIFTMTSKYYQPDIGIAALILSGVCLGFLFFNWHPASIFLGESGSLLLGFILGVLAIISGGKIAITLLVMGIPVMDAAWTILRRIYLGQNPFSFSDQLHLHHRFLSLGIGQRKTVLIFYFLASFFGLSALFLQSLGKFLALVFLGFIMVVLIFFLNKKLK